MMRVLYFLSISFALLAFDVMAQKQKPQTKIPTCTARIESLPKVRGFFLGQSYSEVATRIESLKDVSVNRFAPSTLHLVFYADTDYSGTEFYGVSGVSFSFFSNKVSSLSISYSEFNPIDIKNFIKQVSSNLEVPVASWKIEKQHSAVLTCKDFRINIWDGRNSQNRDYQSHPLMELTDIAAEREELRLAKKKEQDEKERKRLEKLKELEEKRRKEKEQRIFKP
ncbi:MAG TPA: hypothetical protein PKE69_06465 [Pyrinomonadaceae bacterium]|nr:hypothetical protein [Pyrinomonadaceae bacterium]